MATSGVPSDNEKNNANGSTQGPLFYASDTKEYSCGWCGQALGPDHTTDDLEAHFKSCGNSDEIGILMNLEEVQKTSETQTKLDETNTEVGAEKEIEKNISDLKKDLETEIKAREASDQVLATCWNKIIDLEKIVREMGEAKMTEVNGNSSTDSNEPAQWRTEAESIWAQLRNMKTQKENALAEIKTRAETFLERLKTKDAKRPSEDKTSKQKADKKIKKSFHPEPSPLDQFATRMNCFNLVAHNYLFRSSFKWTINGIAAMVAQNTFDLTSELFTWNGYPVQARVKFQLKEDGFFYVSLCLKDEEKRKSFSPVPQVFYFLKDKNVRQPAHTCHSQAYMRGSFFNSSLEWDLCFVHKSKLQHSTCNVDDSVEMEVYVEPFIITQYVHSYNGILEWNVENYARRLRLERKQSLYFQESPYFYTGPKGFRVQVRLCLNGAEGRGPTGRIMFFTGLYDAVLPKTFPHSTTVTLVNRKDPALSVIKTVMKDVRNDCEYMFEICKNEEVKNLIENDALLCRVVIKAQ